MEMVDQVLPARLKSRLFPLREAAGPRDCLDQLGQVGDLPAGLDPEARLETMAWADRRDISQWTLANVLHFMGGRGGRRFSLRAASNEGMSYKKLYEPIWSDLSSTTSPLPPRRPLRWRLVGTQATPPS